MYLDVPFVTQLGIGGNANLNDPTGCWYASACMIGYSYEVGPRLGVPELYSRPIVQPDGSHAIGHWNITGGWLPVFKRNEHLTELDGGMPATEIALVAALKRFGPLFFGWMKTHNGSTYGHASVIIGARGGNVIYHDPENAPRSEASIATFTARLAQGWPLLRRDAPDMSYMVRQVA